MIEVWTNAKKFQMIYKSKTASKFHITGNKLYVQNAFQVTMLKTKLVLKILKKGMIIMILDV